MPTEPASSSIVCANLVKRFAGSVALDGVSFEVAGGVCAMLGPNGAGKSTLLKLLAGLAAPDAGEVKLAGLDPAKHRVEVNQTLGVLPEELGVFDDLSIVENLELVGPVYGLGAEETATRASDLLAMLRLNGDRHTRLKDCSYGMRKKTGIALALLHNPRIVLLDEPFEGIDPASSFAIQQTITTIAARGTTVLFTSHMLALVERLASRVILLSRGRVVLDASQSLLSRPLEELYFELVGVPEFEPIPWLSGGHETTTS